MKKMRHQNHLEMMLIILTDILMDAKTLFIFKQEKDLKMHARTSCGFLSQDVRRTKTVYEEAVDLIFCDKILLA